MSMTSASPRVESWSSPLWTLTRSKLAIWSRGEKASGKESQLDAELEEMGPVDYLVIEWPERQPTGEAAPHLVDLVENGLIRVLDLAFIRKDEDGSVAGLEISEVGDQVAEMKVFEGASSGLLSDDDIAEAGNDLEPG